jgi:hypothetical protein
MNIGDILCSKQSYGMTIVTFYKVIGVTPSGKSVKLKKLKNKVVSDDGYGQEGYVVPSDVEGDKVLVKRLGKTSSGDDYVKISDYEYAYHWNGENQYFTFLD